MKQAYPGSYVRRRSPVRMTGIKDNIMLTRINDNTKYDFSDVSLPIAEVRFPAPLRAGWNIPARRTGTWNIVHTGMLVPEAHEIFVCAASCLRGVVLTAAEIHAMLTAFPLSGSGRRTSTAGRWKRS